MNALYIVAGVVLTGAFVMVGAMDYADEIEREAMEKEARVARMLSWQDEAWLRRHDRALRQCPTQQYISQCCQNGRIDLTCIDGEIK
jgi:hypothetical protein